MLVARNNAALTTPISISGSGNTTVSFDTTVVSTGHATLNNNVISVSDTGYYNATCQVTLVNTSSSAPVTLTLTEVLDGESATGGTSIVTIPESGTATLTLDRVVKVINAASGIATISWILSGGAANLTNAYCIVSKYA